MSSTSPPDEATVLTRKIIDISLRLGIILALVVFSFWIMRPFLGALAWGAILAVALFPVFARASDRCGGRRKMVGILFILLSIALIMVPAFLLVTESLEGVSRFAEKWDNGTLQVPPPNEKIQKWPLIGEKTYGLWKQAHDDLEGTAARFAPQLKALGKGTFGLLTGAGGQMLVLTFSLVLAGVFMINGDTCHRFIQRFGYRLGGSEGGGAMALAMGTIRSVALGVVGTACIQAAMAALGLWLMDIPLAALWAILVLILAICQVTPILVLGPIAAVAFSTHGLVPAILFLVWSLVVAVSDGFLKPMLFGRGVEIPMLVILIGAIGGLIAAGIIGLFIGAVVLALSYRHFMAWLERDQVTEAGPVVESSSEEDAPGDASPGD